MLPLGTKPALSTKPLSMAGLLQLLVSLRDRFTFFFFSPRLFLKCFVTQMCSDVILFHLSCIPFLPVSYLIWSCTYNCKHYIFMLCIDTLAVF